MNSNNITIKIIAAEVLLVLFFGFITFPKNSHLGEGVLI